MTEKLCPIFSIIAPLAYLQAGGSNIPSIDYTCLGCQCSWWVDGKCAIAIIAEGMKRGE